ncbi:glycosyltransferase family 4 protein [Constantimarinum furrinae]|uniref:Glycosyl transferase n=1 Tax=Constantimarinum furrinae TaxID=2562285 RepID=A0A7G8PQS8_9FLAO|nr:glycosyltransferase family 4 protein [Constantimarinum furrinae]QNJ96694.1 glycosyl transferase [Constantimarinum furrinae]
MTFSIITHTPHIIKDSSWFAYGPYVREMNIWGKHVDEIIVVAPVSKAEISKIHLAYSHSTITVYPVPAISFTSFFEAIQAIVFIPYIKFQILRAMLKSDHIHLRCPGNIGLLGCFIQILFPKKPKTAKYAGNWDPKSKQPWSYRLQKWLLSNTFLSRNIKVLVYGAWPGQSKNIRSFFTATYPKLKIATHRKRDYTGELNFLFVGSLAPGKQPLYAVELIEQLNEHGFSCRLDLYGEGAERHKLETYIEMHGLKEVVALHGNESAERIEQAYQDSHFLILPSRSEGWPKVVAEAMFWGVIPVVTRISCVPWMLEHGERGMLLDNRIEIDLERLQSLIRNKEKLTSMSKKGQEWSQQYTLDQFEAEITKLLK